MFDFLHNVTTRLYKLSFYVIKYTTIGSYVEVTSDQWYGHELSLY